MPCQRPTTTVLLLPANRVAKSRTLHGATTNSLTFGFYLESFPPLHLVVRYTWVDERYLRRVPRFPSYADAMTCSFARSQDITRMSQAPILPNLFQVPEYDDENDDEDDISFIQETVLDPKLEVVLPQARDPQASCVGDAIPNSPGQGLHSARNLHNPPPSFASSPLVRKHETIPRSSLSDSQPSVAASGPSGLSEAERQVDKQAMKLDEHLSFSAGSSTSSDLQSPTKSISSLPTSSQSKESKGSLHAKSSGHAIRQPTNQLHDLKNREIAVDEDLTQSESDLDEPFSPDLMVDDSEDGQRHDDPATDCGSDSDEEALLMADKCRSKKAPFIEESTDSESSRSDLSDDIGMEREEDFFVHSENKMASSNLPLSKNDTSDYSKPPAEHEAVSYNMRPGNFTLPSSRLPLPSNPLNRAPSPSDAAMAKPCDFGSGVSGAPGGLYPCTHPQSWSNPMPSAYSPAWPCAFEGRPHVPYDERFGGFQYPYGVSCAPGQFSSDSFRTFTPPVPMLPDQSFKSDQSTTKQPHRPSSDGARSLSGCRLQPISPISITNVQSKVQTEFARSPNSPHKPAAKLSINSIVHHVAEEPVSSQNRNDLKRKADDMSGGNAAESASESPQEVTQAEDTQASICPPLPTTVSAAQVKSLHPIPSSGCIDGNRPAKRARMGNETNRTSFATLAATALAGAVVGGLGVVAALVSLPQDFFV